MDPPFTCTLPQRSELQIWREKITIEFTHFLVISMTILYYYVPHFNNWVLDPQWNKNWIRICSELRIRICSELRSWFRICIKLRSWVRICIDINCWIRIRINGMRSTNFFFIRKIQNLVKYWSISHTSFLTEYVCTVYMVSQQIYGVFICEKQLQASDLFQYGSQFSTYSESAIFKVTEHRT